MALAGGVAMLLGGVAYSMVADRTAAQSAQTAPADALVTGTSGPASRATGPSGLPLPRFVSLKSDRVNVRKGPSSDHAVSWVFTRKGMPVEIIAESDHWRRIRDSEGAEGWVYKSLLDGERTGMVAPWRDAEAVVLRHDPAASSNPVAMVRSGVIGDIVECSGHWCEFTARGYSGWIEQAMLWGVYPGEKVGR